MSSDRRARGMRFAVRIATMLVVVLAWPTHADAQSIRYSLSGNTRAQIGNGFPMPITFQPIPNGKVVMPAGARIRQTTGADPKAMTFDLNTATPLFGPSTITVGGGIFGNNVDQIRTSLIVNGPAGGTAMFSRGGRTGPKTFTWCPGQPLPTASFNPNCSNPLTATGVTVKASIRYEATTGSLAEGWGFGGVYQAIQGGGSKGGASIVLRAGTGLAPCRHPMFTGPQPMKAGCIAGFTRPAIPPAAVIGGPIGFAFASVPPPSPGNVHPVAITTNGLVTKVGATPLGTFPKNSVKSYGGPWTTGKVTVRAPLANASAATFYLQGGDQRVNGLGSISLVAGGVSARSLSGDNANRGWQNWIVSGVAVPSVSAGGLVLLGALFLATTFWTLRRARALER